MDSTDSTDSNTDSTMTLEEARTHIRPLDKADRSASAAIRRGDLVRLGPGSVLESEIWWRLDDRQRTLLVARVVIPADDEDPVLSHGTAARLWGLPIVGDAAQGGRYGVECVAYCATSGRARRRADLRRTVTTLHPGDVDVVDGVRVTSLRRTVLDIARTAAEDDAVAVFDHVMHDGLFTRAELDHLIRTSPERRGITAARRALTAADGRCADPDESHSRLLVARLGFPAPEVGVPFLTDDGPFRAMFWWPAHGVVGRFDRSVTTDDSDVRAVHGSPRPLWACDESWRAPSGVDGPSARPSAWPCRDCNDLDPARACDFGATCRLRPRADDVEHVATLTDPCDLAASEAEQCDRADWCDRVERCDRADWSAGIETGPFARSHVRPIDDPEDVILRRRRFLLERAGIVLVEWGPEHLQHPFMLEVRLRAAGLPLGGYPSPAPRFWRRTPSMDLRGQGDQGDQGDRWSVDDLSMQFQDTRWSGAEDVDPVQPAEGT